MSTTEAIESTDRTALTTLQDAMESAVEYIGGASATAGASVKSVAGKTGELVGVGAYKGAYGVSYGVVFSAVFLKELLPSGSAVRRGFEDGAEAAYDAVEARKTKSEIVADEAGEPAPKVKATRKTAKSAD